MNIEPQELMRRISQLNDQDLLRMAYVDHVQYRLEAITHAEAEIKRRGISFDSAVEIIATDRTAVLPLRALGRKIWKTMRFSAFGIGFVIGLLPFILINISSYNRMYIGGCDDCVVFFGFPFHLYQTGGFAGPTIILWDGLIAYVVIALCASVFAGWILKRLLYRISLRHRAT